MKDFPKNDTQSAEGVEELLDFIVNERRNDINDFINLKNVFISGRKVGKIPSGASDIEVTDRVGDINYDASYLYIVIDNGGTAEWRRIALSSW